MSNVDAILKERGSRYGEYVPMAKISQELKRVMREYGNYNELPDYMKETLDMVCHKLSRILEGDPTYEDSWVDIQGYVELVIKELKKI